MNLILETERKRFDNDLLTDESENVKVDKLFLIAVEDSKFIISQC